MFEFRSITAKEVYVLKDNSFSLATKMEIIRSLQMHYFFLKVHFSHLLFCTMKRLSTVKKQKCGFVELSTTHNELSKMEIINKYNVLIF